MTALTRWNPFDEMLARWPRGFFSRELTPAGLEWSPTCDVTEADGAIVVHAELPGVKAEDMEVSVGGGQLTIRGEKRSEKEQDEEGRRYRERFFGSFQRTITIPEGVDQASIEAKLKDGVLEVRIPVPPAVKTETKKIEIKAE